VVLHGHGGGLVAVDLGLVFGLPAARCTSAPRVGAVESPSALITSPVSRLSLSSHIDNLPALSYLLRCALARFTVQIFTFVQSASSCKALFRYPNSPLNSTMQKEDSPSHQNIGTYMEY
jgi:hypothetical protein